MKTISFTVIILFILTFLSCKKELIYQFIIPIPNGDFELWDNMPSLYFWQTNSCPLCMPANEAYIVRKETGIANGQFAAKFVYNNLYSSYAINRFPISLHPTLLTGYIKSTIANGDTAFIHIELFSGGSIVDNGNFYETISHSNYRKIEIAISQDARNIDSALIKIVGGKKQGTELFVDNLLLIKNNN